MQAFKTGPLVAVEINEDTFNWAKSRYYEMMKWDPETGVPTAGKLHEVGLGWAIPEIS